MTMMTVLRLCLAVSLVCLTSGEVTMADERKEEMGEADSGAAGGTGGSRGRKKGGREALASFGGGLGSSSDPGAHGENLGGGPGQGRGGLDNVTGGGRVTPSVTPSSPRSGGTVRQTLGPRTQVQPQNAADTGEDTKSTTPVRDAGTTGFAGAQPSGRRKRRSATALTIGPASTTRKTLLGT